MKEECQVCGEDNQGQVLRLDLHAANGQCYAVAGPVCAGCALDTATTVSAGVPDATNWTLVDLAHQPIRTVMGGNLKEEPS